MNGRSDWRVGHEKVIEEIPIHHVEVTVQIWFVFPPPQVQICKTFWLVLFPSVRSKQKFAVVSWIVPDVVTGVQVCCGKLAKHCQIFILTPSAPIKVWVRGMDVKGKIYIEIEHRHQDTIEIHRQGWLRLRHYRSIATSGCWTRYNRS